MFDKLKILFKKTFTFLRVGIWRVDTNGIGFIRSSSYNVIKSFILTYRNLNFTQINTDASALTYNTLLAIVPLLAVLFAIARGFGLEKLLQTELANYFAGQKDILLKATDFINKSLEYAQSGIFVGVGVVMLLYTAINLISNIEDRFNAVWNVKVGRSYYRQFTDYFALILIAPIFIICNAGITILLTSSADQYFFVGLFISPFIKILPYIITVLLFTFVYLYIPNTKVKLTSAFFAGLVAGIVFQTFQEVYITGQIWISKYNAIYGSFAALPLLFLWMQVSWFITLIGVQLAFSFQHVKKFSYEKDTEHISQRYKDFILLVIMSIIIKRFARAQQPYSADQLSENYKIPTRLISNSLYFLEQVNLVTKTAPDKHGTYYYVPAVDINQITIGYFFDKIYLYGSENLDLDIKARFANEWKIFTDFRDNLDINHQDLYIKDL